MTEPERHSTEEQAEVRPEEGHGEGQQAGEQEQQGFLAKLAAQFVKFGIVGVTNTLLSYAIYAGMVYVGCHYFVASIVSWVISVAWSFYWNNRMVFTLEEGESRNWWEALLKTYASYALTGLVLANILLFVQIELLGINEYIAPIVNLVITVPLNFVLNRNWAFKKK